MSSGLRLGRSERGRWRQWPWPVLDPPGYIFVGRAIEQLGAGLFGDDWAGMDQFNDPLFEIPPTAAFIGEELRIAFERWQQTHARALTQWRKLSTDLTEALVADNLRSSVRLKDGQMQAIEAFRWNTDDAALDLLSCKITQTPEPASERVYVFVNAEDFEALLDGRTPSDKPDWWPREKGKGKAKPWVMGATAPAILAEARRRARKAHPNPGEKQTCEALVVMWFEATREALKWTSFQQYLIANRHSEER